MKLPLIPHDKANHIIYGVIIFSLSTMFFNFLISFGITLFFANFKEVYDYDKYGKFDVLDLLATISLPLIYLIYKILLSL